MTEDSKNFLTAAEAAKRRHRTVQALAMERAREDGPPYIRDGRRILYPLREFEEFLAERLVKPPAPQPRKPPVQTGRRQASTSLVECRLKANEAIAHEVRILLSEQGRTQNDLTDLLEIPRSSLTRSLSGDVSRPRDWKAYEVVLLATFFDVETAHFFRSLESGRK